MRVRGRVVEEDHPLLVPLPRDPDHAVVEVDGLDPHGAELGDADAGGVDQADDQAVARVLDRAQEARDLPVLEALDPGPADLRPLDPVDRVRVDRALRDEKAEERRVRADEPVQGPRREVAFLGDGGQVIVERGRRDVGRQPRPFRARRERRVRPQASGATGGRSRSSARSSGACAGSRRTGRSSRPASGPPHIALRAVLRRRLRRITVAVRAPPCQRSVVMSCRDRGRLPVQEGAGGTRPDPIATTYPYSIIRFIGPIRRGHERIRNPPIDAEIRGRCGTVQPVVRTARAFGRESSRGDGDVHAAGLSVRGQRTFP